MKLRQISWETSRYGGPLGRHIEHDPRSRNFAVDPPPEGVRKPVLWERHGKILDQGQLGSCTGNALVGALECDPLHHRYERWTEKKAVRVYARATVIDGFPGEYPPDDTGSSGTAVCKAAAEFGWISEYRWAFGIEQALDALQTGPVITGVEWREGFDRPDAAGLVKLEGQVRGGHEFVVRGYEPVVQEVYCSNSWGDGWGFHGNFRMTVSTWAALLDADGDVTVPRR